MSTFWQQLGANRRPIISALILLATCVICYLCVILADGIGPLIFVVTALFFLVAIITGPRRRGVTSPGLVVLPGVAAVVFLISFAARTAPGDSWIAHIRLGDVSSSAGYVILAVLLRQLSRKCAPRNRYETWLDTLMVATGVSLSFWSLAVASSLANRHLSVDTVLLALYPALDVVLVTLTAQLIYRIGTAVTAMAWFLMAVIAMLIIDTSYTMVWLARPGQFVPALSVCYLLTYAGFALGLWHPSVTVLDHGKMLTGLRQLTHRRRGLAMVFILLPSVASVALPTHGLFDTAARVVLIMVAIALMYARLDYALRTAERAEQHSAHQARHDQLTGLGNRVLLAERLPQALHRAARGVQVLGVLLLDLDGFKRINDTWGHSVGDDALKAVAARLEANTEWALFTVRLGGDEFLVGVEEASTKEVISRADSLRAMFDVPLFLANGATLTITPSIGVTTVEPSRSPTPEQVVHEADVALHEAKQRGKSRSVVYRGAIRDADELKRRLRHDLGEAIRGNEVATAFQPIVSAIEPYPIRGWEALARWHHRDHGVVSPEVFIAVAEEQGLLDDLLAHVIANACDFVRRRNATRFGEEAREWVSVNVTPAQILGPDFVQRLLGQLHAASVPPSCLRLEITETAIMPSDERAKDRLEVLRKAGIGVFLDDFGSGFAGIGILRHLQFDAVKIDRSFVGRTWSAPDLAALRGIMELARGLNVHALIAEGVETIADARVVEKLGIELAQGWFYGAPSNPDLSQDHAMSQDHTAPPLQPISVASLTSVAATGP